MWRNLFPPAGGKGPNKKYSSLFLILILLLGITLMYAGPNFISKPRGGVHTVEPSAPLSSPQRESSLAEEPVRALEEILEHIDGISNVHVYITYSESKESVFARAYDENRRHTAEQDREGGTREIEELTRHEEQVLVRDGGGGETALLLKEIMPKIKGILVVAKGAENSYLRLEIVRAIQRVLNVPVHRIALLPCGN